MARLTDDAETQIIALGLHYQRLDRIEALERLRGAVEQALRQADQTGKRGRAFPSVYRELAEPGRYWLKVHRYWFAYEIEAHETIVTHVLYDQADIPKRFGR